MRVRIARALARRDDLRERLAHGVAGGKLARGELGEAEDDREHVVEIVGDAAREQTDGLHLLRLPQLLLDALARRDVLHDRDAARRSPVGVQQDAERGLDRQLVARERRVDELSDPPPRRLQGGHHGVPALGPARAKQLLAVLAERLLFGPTVQLRRGGVPVGDARAAVGCDDRLADLRERLGLEREALLGELSVGDVARVEHDGAYVGVFDQVRRSTGKRTPSAALRA